MRMNGKEGMLLFSSANVFARMVDPICWFVNVIRVEEVTCPKQVFGVNFSSTNAGRAATGRLKRRSQVLF